MDSPLDELSIDVGTLIVAVLLLCSVAAAPPALELFVPGSDLTERAPKSKSLLRDSGSDGRRSVTSRVSVGFRGVAGTRWSPFAA